MSDPSAFEEEFPTRRVLVTYLITYDTDAPKDYDADRALSILLDRAPQGLALTGADELMDDAYDFEAVGWDIRTEEWGDIGTGVHLPDPLREALRTLYDLAEHNVSSVSSSTILRVAGAALGRRGR